MQTTIDGINFNTDTATWVARIEQGGALAAVLYQRPGGGEYFVHRIASDAIEPITEFEARRLMRDLVEHAQIEKALEELAGTMLSEFGIELDCSTMAEVRARAHKEARRRGLVKGSAPNLRKILGS